MSSRVGNGPFTRRVRLDAVVKVGGSLASRSTALRRLMKELERLSVSFTLVVVPGGGGFADEVRRMDRRFRFDRSSAHWMAILAMDQSAYLLRDLTSRGVLVRHPAEVRRGRLNVLAPSAWLMRADALPHSWSVTSDSIAAWVAGRLGARALVLLKSVDGARARNGARGVRREATRRALGDVVDDYFPRALRANTVCWIVNGARPERLATLLATGATLGTRVIDARPPRQRQRGPRPRPRARGDRGPARARRPARR